MALTSLQLDETNRLQFITDPFEEGLRVLVYTCDDKWTPQGDPATSFDKRSEELFHKELRVEASKKGHYKSEYSTNPEWNPENKEENESTI